MPTAQPERTLLMAAGRCPSSRCATPPAPNQNSNNSADAQRLRAPLHPNSQPGAALGQLQLSDLLSGVRELSGAVRSCPVLACGGWAAGRGLGCWSGVSAGNDEWTKVAER